MNVWILRALRGDARGWWAHRELRGRGDIEEAARRERASMRSSLDVIRKALATRNAYVSTGRGGTTVHFGRGATLSSYGQFDQMVTAQVLVRMGLPCIDTNPVENPWALVGLPMVAVGIADDDPPWHAMAYAPLAVYAARAKDLGAIVRNVGVRPDTPIAA